MQIIIVFVVMSVVDTFSLTEYFNVMLSSFLYNYWSLENWDAGCEILKWIGYSSQVCSSYYVLLFTMERFISVRFPLKRAVIWTRKRTHIAIVAIFLIAALSMTYHLHFWNASQSCEYLV